MLKVFGYKVLGVFGHMGNRMGKGENYLKEVDITMETNYMRLYKVKHIVHMGKIWHTKFLLENFMEEDHFKDH
jgi:hypothetical protein